MKGGRRRKEHQGRKGRNVKEGRKEGRKERKNNRGRKEGNI
jgi:hypothetical protein